MKKIDAVLIPYNDFLKGIIFGFRTRDQHLVSEILKDERIGKVIIVERPRSIFTFAKFSRFEMIRGEKIGENLKRVDDKVFVFEFFNFGLSQSWLKHLWFDKIYRSDEFVGKFIKALEVVGLKDFFVLSFNPFANGFVSSLEAKKVIFDVMDNFCFHLEFHDFKNYICQSFEWISSNADLIFCVNDNLKEFFERNYPASLGKIYVLPNGVDKNLKASGSVPKDIAKINAPRIGYAGVISSRIDFELVEYLASERGHYNFIFIGSGYGDVKGWVKKLKKFKNVYLLGDKHYNVLPCYISSFDVCIIPHKVDEFTLSNDPIKVYEYLYFGKPVISTGVSLSDELKNYVFIAKSEKEFLGFLDIAVELSKDVEFVLKQRGAIKEWMFWDKRASFMLDKIFSLLS